MAAYLMPMKLYETLIEIGLSGKWCSSRILFVHMSNDGGLDSHLSCILHICSLFQIWNLCYARIRVSSTKKKWMILIMWLSLQIKHENTSLHFAYLLTFSIIKPLLCKNTGISNKKKRWMILIMWLPLQIKHENTIQFLAEFPVHLVQELISKDRS